MKNSIVWTTDVALELESLFHKESILDEHLEVVDSLILRWQRIAILIKFDFSNEDDILKIKELIPVTDQTSPLAIFDSATEAIDFFQDMRTIIARKALFFFRQTQGQYAPSVQGLIKHCSDIIRESPVIYHQKPNVYLEDIVFCMQKAVAANDITYDVLRHFHKIIHDLEMYNAKYHAHLSKKAQRKNISAGKADEVKWRQDIFAEFAAYYEGRQKDSQGISMHKAAIDFFKLHSKDDKFTGKWKTGESFYRSYTERKQDSQKKSMHRMQKYNDEQNCFEIPADIVAALKKL